MGKCVLNVVLNKALHVNYITLLGLNSYRSLHEPGPGPGAPFSMCYALSEGPLGRTALRPPRMGGGWARARLMRGSIATQPKKDQ